jgi:chromosome segregation ATPase
VVESALFFVIGFLSAAMLAIFAAPAVARRAMRLANARARLQAPLSETQARAERDALRAIHAVEMVKMERKLAVADWDRAVAKTDLARQTNRMAKLTDLGRSLVEDIRSRDARIDEMEVAARALEAESGAKDVALRDFAGQRDVLRDRLSAARSKISTLETQADRSRMEIAILATKVSALEFEMADIRSGKTPFDGENAQGLEERLRLSEQAREAQTLELARQMRLAAEREAVLAATRAMRDKLAQKLQASERRFNEVEESLRSKAQSLTTTNAANSGALAAERADRLQLRQERDALQQRLDDAVASVETMTKGDAALRLAIAKLGRDIVRARSPQDEEPHGEAQIVNFIRREPIS